MRNIHTTFTRQGSQVQSLYRPPRNTFLFQHLREFFGALEKLWGQTGVEVNSSPLPPFVNCVTSLGKEGLSLAHSESARSTMSAHMEVT
jgi:hypothetical protein